MEQDKKDEGVIIEANYTSFTNFDGTAESWKHFQRRSRFCQWLREETGMPFWMAAAIVTNESFI